MSTTRNAYICRSKHNDMKTNFKVGNKVWDAIHYQGQDGKVVEANNTYLTIKFKQAALVQYFTDGRIAMSGTLPTLSKVPYTFELPEQPVEFEEGDPVLVRDKDEHIWTGSRYKCKGLDDHYPYETLIGSTSVSWRQCIPFDIEKMGRA